MSKLLNLANMNNVNHLKKHLKKQQNQQELNEALQIACENGFTLMAQMLLEDGRANPHAQDPLAGHYQFYKQNTRNFALQRAAANGHDDIVSLLLKDGRSDPSVSFYRAVKLAIVAKQSSVLCIFDDYFKTKNIDYKKCLGSKFTLALSSLLPDESCIYKQYKF